MSRNDKEFYDLVYDVWRAGGNPDSVDRDRFEDKYEGSYDFISDTHVLQAELRRQVHDQTKEEGKISES